MATSDRSRAIARRIGALLCAGTAAIAHGAPRIEPSGGGDAPIEVIDDLSPVARVAIEARLAAARAALTIDRIAAFAPEPRLELEWPLRPRDGFPHPGYHATSNFVDLDLGYPDLLLDWGCGKRSYDTAAGYNHTGTDFFLWPFPWTKMFDEDIEIVAAAPGTILDKQDGAFDGSCELGEEDWNAVYVLHDDGSVAWYGHMKSGSPTSKAIGERVETGERLGLVGSSGSSTTPHLHFEVHDASGAIVDPYAGSCHQTASLWRQQRPYFDSALNQIATHAAAPDVNACNEPEQIQARDRFSAGEAIVFAAYYRDQLEGQVTTHTVLRPDGEVQWTWDHDSAVEHSDSSYWWWDAKLPDDAMPGTWHYEAAFLEQHASHEFEVVPEADGAAAALAALLALRVTRSSRRTDSRGGRAR